LTVDLPLWKQYWLYQVGGVVFALHGIYRVIGGGRIGWSLIVGIFMIAAGRFVRKYNLIKPMQASELEKNQE